MKGRTFNTANLPVCLIDFNYARDRNTAKFYSYFRHFGESVIFVFRQTKSKFAHGEWRSLSANPDLPSRFCKAPRLRYESQWFEEIVAWKRSRGEPRQRPGAKTIKNNTNSTQNKSQTHRAKQYEVTSFLSTDCELSSETCSKNVYSLGP